MDLFSDDTIYLPFLLLGWVNCPRLVPVGSRERERERGGPVDGQEDVRLVQGI